MRRRLTDTISRASTKKTYALAACALLACAACAKHGDASSQGTGAAASGAGGGAGGGGTPATTGTASAGTSSGAGGVASGAGSASSATSGSGGGAASSSSSGSTSTGGSVPNGNPSGSCSTGVPAEGVAVDTSHPTTVVGKGTAASCTFGALQAAVAAGGIVTFDCGDAPATIAVTATLVPPTSNAYAGDAPLHIVIDGGDKITLDGGKAVRILSWIHAGSWQKNTDTLTLQHLTLVNGKTTPTEKIPACPPSGSITNAMCSTGYDDGQGGAVDMQDGSLRVIDCKFANNQAALLGPDTGGGAIYLYGTGTPSYIVQSTFQGNTASNAGAVGMLWAGAFIVDSLFEGNSAVGTGANSDDATECTCMNAGQNQIGSGGNGGAIYKDGGDGATLTICGTQIRDNSANEFGAAVFLTADGSGAKLVIQDSLMTDNPSPISYWNWCTGVSTDNPHEAGSTTCSPSPVDSTFCDTKGNCATTCSS